MQQGSTPSQSLPSKQSYQAIFLVVGALVFVLSILTFLKYGFDLSRILLYLNRIPRMTELLEVIASIVGLVVGAKLIIDGIMGPKVRISELIQKKLNIDSLDPWISKKVAGSLGGEARIVNPLFTSLFGLFKQQVVFLILSIVALVFSISIFGQDLVMGPFTYLIAYLVLSVLMYGLIYYSAQTREVCNGSYITKQKIDVEHPNEAFINLTHKLDSLGYETSNSKSLTFEEAMSGSSTAFQGEIIGEAAITLNENNRFPMIGTGILLAGGVFMIIGFYLVFNLPLINPTLYTSIPTDVPTTTLFFGLLFFSLFVAGTITSYGVATVELSKSFFNNHLFDSNIIDIKVEGIAYNIEIASMERLATKEAFMKSNLTLTFRGGEAVTQLNQKSDEREIVLINHGDIIKNQIENLKNTVIMELSKEFETKAVYFQHPSKQFKEMLPSQQQEKMLPREEKIACPKCENDNPPGSNYCVHCGNKLQ